MSVSPNLNRSPLTQSRSHGRVGREGVRRRMGRALLYAALLVATALFAVPLVWLILGSLKLNGEFGAYPVRILPRTPIWSNYYEAVTIVPFFTYAGRSLLLAGTYTVLTVVTSALVGFGFARHRAPGRDTLFILVLAMIMVPGIVTIIPQFILYSRLRLVGTYWPWVLWGLSGSPFFIFLFRQFFAGFPRELEHAAEVDGAGRFRIFWQIFMPNAGPVIAAAAIFAFQGVWGDFFLQSLFLSERNATLAMKLVSAYRDPRGNPLYTQTMAAVVIFVAPLVVLFFVAQKSIIRGVVTTGLK